MLESWTDGEHRESYTYNASRLLSSVTNAEGTTSFVWDILTGDGVVISAESGSNTTDYLYGLERIAALNGKNKTEYAYDGRGSVAAELRYTDAWYTLGGALSSADVTSKSYTPFGEQIGEAVSGFGYNGEYYNAVTGMIYLRARFYEPEMNKFSQKDILRGNILNTRSLNRYSYVQNDPVNYYDPSGEFGLLVGTAIAAGISGLIAGGVSAYQSYKATGKVDWKQAGKAALGGATAAVAVGVAVATGGAGFGLATMAIEAYAGVRTTMRGGGAAAVTTSMANAGAAAVIARTVSPYIPPVVNLAIGSAGTAASGYKTVVDTRSAVSVFNNPRATTMDKLNAVTDVAEDVIGFYGSAKMAADSYRILFSSNNANYLCSRYQNSDDSDITDTPKVAADDNVEYNDLPENVSNGNNLVNPADYLNEALKRQGIDSAYDKMTYSWSDGEYNYEVHSHKGNSQYTSSELIYRVMRKRVPSSDPSVQGSGEEYLGLDEIWYKKSILTETFRNGSPNPSFNEEAARLTHVPVGG